MPRSELKTKVPLLAGGISRQPPHIRLPGQVEDAENFAFSVVDGASQRSGTEYMTTIAGLPTAGDFRIHAINRDHLEKYIVIYGAGILRVFEVNGPEATVDVSADASDYLDLT